MERFLDDLAAKTPAPGGGGAAAMAGAMSAALAAMVSRFTEGNPRLADVREEAAELIGKADTLRSRFTDAAAADAAAFEPLSKAYGIPKDRPDRAAVLEACLKNAAATPGEIMAICEESLGLLERLAVMGSKIMLSDVICGAILADAAQRTAAVNVRVNTALMKDRAYAEDLEKKTAQKEAELSARAEHVISAVGSRMAG